MSGIITTALLATGRVGVAAPTCKKVLIDWPASSSVARSDLTKALAEAGFEEVGQRLSAGVIVRPEVEVATRRTTRGDFQRMLTVRVQWQPSLESTRVRKLYEGSRALGEPVERERDARGEPQSYLPLFRSAVSRLQAVTAGSNASIRIASRPPGTVRLTGGTLFARMDEALRAVTITTPLALTCLSDGDTLVVDVAAAGHQPHRGLVFRASLGETERAVELAPVGSPSAKRAATQAQAPSPSPWGQKITENLLEVAVSAVTVSILLGLVYLSRRRQPRLKVEVHAPALGAEPSRVRVKVSNLSEGSERTARDLQLSVTDGRHEVWRSTDPIGDLGAGKQATLDIALSDPLGKASVVRVRAWYDLTPLPFPVPMSVSWVPSAEFLQRQALLVERDGAGPFLEVDAREDP